MRQLRSQTLAVIAVSLLALWWGSVTVRACTPSPDTIDLTLADRAENAPVILVGTVVEGYATNYAGGREIIQAVDVEVERYLKGQGPAVVHIAGFGDGADCRSVVSIGERGIFFAEGASDEGLDAVYLGVHDALWVANEETIATVLAITGTDNEPYPLPVTAQLVRFFHDNTAVIVGVLLAGIALLGLLMIRQRVAQRKPKSKRS